MSNSPELAAVLAKLEQMDSRLTKLEGPKKPNEVIHPSQDKFAIAEAIVDSLFQRETKEKACTFEPSGKPCDHCSMCNSRGF